MRGKAEIALKRYTPIGEIYCNAAVLVVIRSSIMALEAHQHDPEKFNRMVDEFIQRLPK